MAAAINFSDEILRIFVDGQRHEMTLNELQNILSNQVTQVTNEDVLRMIRLSCLQNLFNLQVISNELCLIQLNPKLPLCEPCLQRSCKKMNCTKLHICCIMPHFSNKSSEKHCNFPHKLSEHSNNAMLLKQVNYDTLNENLLLDLLRIYYRTNNKQQLSEPNRNPQRLFSTNNDRNRPNSAQLKPPNPRRSRPSPQQLMKLSVPSPVIIDNVLDRQLDISIPSERDAPDVDLEIVQLVLATKDIIMERTLETQISNEFYRRYTMQFPSKQVVDKILQDEPVIIYNNVPIKIKRTVRQRDGKIFGLKFDTDQKINNLRLKLYVETLVGKITSDILDMTPDGSDEQIYLIHCNQAIDYDHLYKVHSAKNTLQGYRATISEVYETETLEVSSVQNSRYAPMSIPRLRQLFGNDRWEKDVFACICIRDQNNADIELMNAEVTATWLEEAQTIQRDLSLIIRPIIDFIPQLKKDEEDIDEEVNKLCSTPKTSSSLSPLNSSNDSPKPVDNSIHYRIRPDWRIVLTHPIFGDEYRKYIREQMNISVQIEGWTIQVPNEYIRKELARHTNMFIQKFVFREFSDLDKAQVRLIKENYSRMAHKWQKDTNKTLVAARREVLNEVFPQAGFNPRPPNKIPNTPTFRLKQSPITKKSEQLSSSSPIEKPMINQSQMKTTDDDLSTLLYSIENAVYFPFFALSNPFPSRLETYLFNTFNVKLDAKSVSPSKFVLELKGQQKDVSDARPALTSLFGSLKTKTYSDTQDSCKFVIPDIEKVTQWNLDQRSTVSSCSFSKKNGGTLSVRYFADNPQFGVDEQQIDDVVLHHLHSSAYRIPISTKKLENSLQEMEKRIRLRSDYGQEICCFYEHEQRSTEGNRPTAFYLCGIKSVVQQIYQEIKKIADECIPVSCNVQLSSDQVNYLLQVCSHDLIKFEKRYEADGVDLRSNLKSDATSQFLAPKNLHEKIKVFLFETSQTQMMSTDYESSRKLVNNTKRDTDNSVSMPSSSQSGASPLMLPATLKIRSGTINVSNGDITTTQCDVLVLCSSSMQLCNIVIKAAGAQTVQDLNGKDLKQNMVDASAGQLTHTKRLLFLPWTPPPEFVAKQDVNVLRQSIFAFVQQAFNYAVQGKFTSIAFPAIGCGGFGISPDIIATAMIDAVREQLVANPVVQLIITFVIQQPQVYNVFCAKINSISTTATTRSLSPHSLSTQKN